MEKISQFYLRSTSSFLWRKHSFDRTVSDSKFHFYNVDLRCNMQTLSERFIATKDLCTDNELMSLYQTAGSTLWHDELWPVVVNNTPGLHQYLCTNACSDLRIMYYSSSGNRKIVVLLEVCCLKLGLNSCGVLQYKLRTLAVKKILDVALVCISSRHGVFPTFSTALSLFCVRWCWHLRVQ